MLQLLNPNDLSRTSRHELGGAAKILRYVYFQIQQTTGCAGRYG